MNKLLNENGKVNILLIIIVLLSGILIGIGSLLIWENIENKYNKLLVEDTETNKDNAKPENKDSIIMEFDGTKCLNSTNENSVYHLDNWKDVSLPSLGMSITLNNEKSVTISIDLSKCSSFYGMQNKTEIKSYDVTNFDKNIKSVYLTGFGQAVGSETIFYIMEDGTVEYTPIRYILKNNDLNDNSIFKSFGKIEGVNDVIKLLDADEIYQGLIDSSVSIIGIKKDGTFYDLSKILYAMEYYKY